MANFDMSRNNETWDNTESVTITLRRETDSEVAIHTAKRTALTTRDIESMGGISDSTEVAFNIPDSILNPANNGREIRRNDLVADSSGRTYAVVNVQLLHSRSRWRAVCRPEIS